LGHVLGVTDSIVEIKRKKEFNVSKLYYSKLDNRSQARKKKSEKTATLKSNLLLPAAIEEGKKVKK